MSLSSEAAVATVPAEHSAENSGSSEPQSRAPRSARFSLIGWVRDVLGISARESSLREVLEEALEDHEADAERPLTVEERSLLQNVLSFGETTVSDVMVPLPDMIAIPLDSPFEEVKRVVQESRHTRLPVYDGNMDHMRGFLHVKDLFDVITSAYAFDIEQVLRPILFVPPGMRIVDLLVEMKRSHLHMAIVVDEFGGTRGLVTLEDLFEELVGDIHDEHDTDEDMVEPQFGFSSEGALDLDAKTRLDDMPESLAQVLQPEDEQESYDTLGGLIAYQLGRVPEAGERILLFSGYRVEVLEADARRALVVRIMRPLAPEAE